MELGSFLPAKTSSRYKVQPERLVGFFGFSRAGFVKKEIDIVLSSVSGAERVAIEVEFPRQWQYPEQMFSFCRDVRLMEQVLAACFSSAHLVDVADDRLFYEGPKGGMYAHFRAGAPLQGVVQKPTGARDELVELCGEYHVGWKPARHVRYFWVQAQ